MLFYNIKYIKLKNLLDILGHNILMYFKTITINKDEKWNEYYNNKYILQMYKIMNWNYLSSTKFEIFKNFQ